MRIRMSLLVMAATITGCEAERSAPQEAPEPGSFAYDLAFLEQHTEVHVLSHPGDAEGPAVLVTPALQGRVMTSTTSGKDGLSLGWINYELISSGDTLAHINPYGGEDRFWMGPEGGQFSLFFAEGDPFDLERWFTPPPIDTEPYRVEGSDDTGVTFTHRFSLENYSGSRFEVALRRSVRLLDRTTASEYLAIPIWDVPMVAFESENTIRNAGSDSWTREGGLVSIWILGMFNPSPTTTVVIPFREGPEDELGPVVNDLYFGKVPEDRIAINEGVLFFSGDGRYRSKIGLSASRAKPVLGSYDAQSNVLTIVQFTRPPGIAPYVNSMWELQDEPYGGDVVNSYNDGPPQPGAKPLGPFYELETSSPAAALAPNETMTHIHRTFHFEGAEGELDRIALAALGVSIHEIRTGVLDSASKDK